MEHLENETLDATIAFKEEVQSLARVVLQNRMALVIQNGYWLHKERFAQ